MIQRNLMTNKTRMNRIHILSRFLAACRLKTAHIQWYAALASNYSSAYSRFQLWKWRCLRLVMDVISTNISVWCWVWVWAYVASPPSMLCMFTFESSFTKREIKYWFSCLLWRFGNISQLVSDASNNFAITRVSDRFSSEPREWIIWIFKSLIRTALDWSESRGRFPNHIPTRYLAFAFVHLIAFRFSHFQFVADFHTVNSSFARTRRGRRKFNWILRKQKKTQYEVNIWKFSLSAIFFPPQRTKWKSEHCENIFDREKRKKKNKQ